MEYLLEVQWSDPVARAVARILSRLPTDVEQTTGVVPLSLSRGFAVVRCPTPNELADIAEAVRAAGAEVRVTPRTEADLPSADARPRRQSGERALGGAAAAGPAVAISATDR
jgi:hypothetical protein